METQPEMPSVPPPEAQAADRSPQAPKGYVVLAIGMPGSGKTTWFRQARRDTAVERFAAQYSF